MRQNTCFNQYKYFAFLSMLYCTLLIASVLLPYKIIDLFGYSMPGGIFIFPLTYLLGGVIAETYGRNMALKMVYSSLACLMIFNIIIALIIRLPSKVDAPNQQIYMQAFGHSLRLSVGCLAGLVCSDLTNIYRITKLKMIFAGKYFIQRCLWATALSEGMFNVVTYTITYYGVVSNSELLKMVFNSWSLKMMYSLIMVFPILFLMRFLKKAEGIDVYDVFVSQYGAINPETIMADFLHASKNKINTIGHETG